MADHDDHSLVFDANFASPFAQAKRMVEHAQLNRASIPPQVGTSSRANAIQVPTPEMKPGKTIEEVERELIYQTLESVEGNKTLAARM
ncbi:helix-turn-helix domain-containing protein, partial [Pseudoalteromonas sp. S3178]